MAKALFLGLPLHGHTNPSLPLVRALVDRGDEVVYVSADPFADAIQQAGARYRPYRNAFLANPADLSRRTDRLPWLLMRTTREVLGVELDTFRAEAPDYVITDSVAPWGQWVAQLLGIPVVTSVTTFAVNRHVLGYAASKGARPKSVGLALSKVRHIVKAALLRRRLRRRYGVRGTSLIGLVFGSSDLNIVYTSRHVQPCADTFDDRFQFIGPSVGTRVEASDAASGTASQMPLIYISLGTLFNADPAFYRHCFEAFGEQHVQVVMSIGAGTAVVSLGAAPANFVVTPWVSQLNVLQQASVFVSHGGMNSVSESLHYGVPLVVVPQMGEQELVGRRIDELGAGLYLAKGDVTADRLRGAVQRLLDDGRFRERAARVRESFDTAGGAARGADAIVSFTRKVERARGVTIT